MGVSGCFILEFELVPFFRARGDTQIMNPPPAGAATLLRLDPSNGSEKLVCVFLMAEGVMLLDSPPAGENNP